MPSSTASPANTAPPHRTPWQRLQQLRRHPAGPWLASGLGAVFALFIVYLLVQNARSIDWAAVWSACLALPVPALVAGGVLALASHLVYSSFDLFGRKYTNTGLSVSRTVAITLVAYPFALNIGSILGGAAVRLRLYGRQGIGALQLGQILGLSIITNWLGYLLLAGALLWAWTPQLPEAWGLSTSALPWTGVVLFTLPLLYIAACQRRGGRALQWRDHHFPLPHAPGGALQVLLSAVNWALMGGAVWLLCGQEVPYAAALAAVLLGAVAGLISRIPAGLGVLETVGVAVLSPYMPQPEALAAILAYRLLYFFLPLGLAIMAFGISEILNKNGSSGKQDERQTLSNQ
ncbi:lysylphosphatidylglycerol synthase transmembrane domain-containing protein [Variovorax sp. HJSM1_2]|uniref:lysylphosphatidylglycerol synthase transmembrane domain-containing protein n=1 Tax=Variovorax sp. HJSM1_2 TaxID=3366263 RepID=UPI003BD38236